MLFSLAGTTQEHYLFIGTYTGNGSKGIYVYRFNNVTGELKWISNTDSVMNPSYLTIAPNGKYIYAVNETGGKQPGQVSSFSFNHATGPLTLINQQLSGGDHPCYISTDKHGRWIVVGNYSSGNLSVLPVNKDGSLQPYTQLIQHTGNSVNKQRQDKPHVHATVFSPDSKYVFSPDLGMDKIMIYPFNSSSQQPLQTLDSSLINTEPGAGPRHFVFHPNKKEAYLIEELSGTVTVYKYNKGKLNALQQISTHPSDYKGVIGSADIHLSPDGKFLYASNRGDANSITIFSIEKRTSKLKWQGYQSTMGTKPRNFTIDPTGQYLLVANQGSNNIVVFKRNAETGLLTDTGHRIEVPSPVCLQFMK